MTAAALHSAPASSRYAALPASGRPLTSVASLNRLLAERGQAGRAQFAALAMSYLIHFIAILAALLILRHKPYRTFSDVGSSDGFSVVSVHPVLGTPDGDPGGPALFVAKPRPAQTEETRSKPAPVATARPLPQPTAARREVTRATPTPQAARAKATPKPSSARSNDGDSTDSGAAQPGAKDPRAAANAELLTRRGGRGTPTGTLGGEEGGGLGALMFSNQWYVAQVRDIVYTNWANPFTGRAQPETQLRVVIEFRIQRDGSIGDARLEEASGNDNYDRSGLRAVQHARLPPLPRDFTGRDVQVSFEFLSNAE